MSRNPTRGLLVRALLSLIVIGSALAIAVTQSPRLGLDLRGGTQIVLEAQDTPDLTVTAQSTDQVLEVLRRRVDALGVSEPNLTRSGERRIIVELPGVQDPREAAEVIGRTAQLTMHPVLGAEPPGQPAAPAREGETVLPDESGALLRLAPAALNGSAIDNAQGQPNEFGTSWGVAVDFDGPGGDAYRQMTAAAACAPPGDPTRRIAIVLDREVISSPQVDPSVGCNVGISGGSTSITGDFGVDGANELATLIQGGSLPVPVEILEQRTVGPTLGADAIQASWQAALIGIAATLLFLSVVYRLFGLLASLGLAAYALIAYAALVWLGSTLTLPGLAGFVLAIGMAVDANVLVFERAREEFAGTGGKLLRSATGGFRNALTAIVDSNVTTLLAAGLLIAFASGPVRGFGVTLTIGVLASMVSALLIVRVMVEAAAGRGWLQRRPALSGVASPGRVRQWLVRRDPQLMRRGRLWLAVSGGLVALSITGVLVRGLDIGVEFTGGRLAEYGASAPIDVERARAAVSDAGFPRAVVQETQQGGVAIRTPQLDNDQEAQVQAALEAVAPGLEQRRDELIGPSLGSELRTKALIALGIALLTQLLYLTIRFRLTFGGAAILAMAHDVIVLIGAFAWLGRPVDGVFLAAMLTVIGYSVNDTVVVFDRVREERRRAPAADFARTVNTAVLQTVPRTVNTGIGALFVLLALAVLGGDSLEDFAIALLIGIGVGTLSTTFTASPALIELERRSAGADSRRGGRSPAAPGGASAPDPRAVDADPYGRGAGRPNDSGAVL
jgi:SecD/SecF fusion protein